MAKRCVKCGKPIPFLEGVRHAEGMYCRQCDIEAFVKENCSSDEFIEECKREAALAAEKRKASAEQQPSPVEEIRKFKALLDDGIISQEEFESKKKQLLGL